VLHTALREYLPFVILLFALFVVSGSIRVRGNMVGTPPSIPGYSRSARRSPASPARPAPPCCWFGPSSRPTSAAAVGEVRQTGFRIGELVPPLITAA